MQILFCGNIFRRLLVSVIFAFTFIVVSSHAQTVLFGDQTIEGQRDSDSLGSAEAFQTTATANGTLNSLALYLDSSATVKTVTVGLYTDKSGHPGTLLTQGSTTAIQAGAWNTINVPAISVTSSTHYWIAVLGTGGGSFFFRDRNRGPCKSELNKTTGLTTLPATWTSGSSFTDCPLSGYGQGTATGTPILNVNPTSLSFSAVQGGANPSPTTFSITNTGTGTLSYSITSDAGWLSASPTSGTAPQTVTVSANITGLTANTYTGHLTVTATGAQGSPATVTVTLTVTSPPPQPILTVSPTSLSFSGSQGGSNPSSQPINISNTGTGTLSFSISSDATWLSASPTSGTAPSSPQVTATIGTLTPNTYTGHLTITANGAQGSPATVTVTLTVTNPQPILSVSPQNLSFGGVQGGADPSTQPVNITNTGTGTLSFSVTSDSGWLSALPTSGSAPATLQVKSSVGSLTAGTYTGHLTITATGAQGSPATVTVTFNISAPTQPSAVGDWVMIDHDPGRSGFASDEAAVSTTTAPNLKPRWTVNLDGQVSAQPLYLGSISIGSLVRDLLVVATAGNSIYALDANSGDILWTRNFGSQGSNCVLSGGFGVFGAPYVDRTALRVYAVSDDGSLRTISLLDGTDAAPALSLVANPNTNKVWGGLNRLGNNLYFATASDGCDDAPWRGQIYMIDLSGANPAFVKSFVVVPGIPAPNGGGGIWGYGGVSIDTNTGNVFAATADDSNEAYSLYANRIIALDANLNLLGTFAPSHPINFSCSSAPCDVDFGSTPILFQPNGCSLLTAAGNKDGNLYLLNASDVINSGPVLQALTLSNANDSLGSGGVGGVPAFWPQGNMLFVTDRGGVSGIAGGVVGLNVTNACTLQVGWSLALGSSDLPNSTPTVANGVVFVGAGDTGQVHAYNALTGTELWNSGTAHGASTFGAPMVARGKVYFGSWGGFGAGAGGEIYTFAPDPFPGPVLGGNQTVETNVDFNPAGTAEAFPFSAGSSGTLSGLAIFIDASSTATQLFAGIYADANGHPGSLLTQADVNTVTPGAWITVNMPTTNIVAGTQYWIAVLGTKSGTLKFRDRNAGPCTSETSSQTGLTQLPGTWTTGATSGTCPISGYVIGVTPSQPILTVTPSNLALSAPQGQATQGSINVINSGGGSLSFTTSSDSTWLTVLPPTSGTAPQTLQVNADSTGLGQNTYTGHITVTSTGTQGSPASVTVQFTVQPPPPPNPILNVSPSSLSFSGTQGGANPAVQNVSVTNTGSGTLSFTTSSDSSWLSVSPGSANAPQTLQVSVNLANLTANTYTGHVTVTGAAGVQNSPATVTVTLVVAAPPPPSTLLFGDTATEGQRDQNSLGTAEAFQTTAVATGPLGDMFVYLDSSSTVSTIWIGLYTDNGGHPGTLLTQASSSSLTSGTWNTIPVPAVGITSGTSYWIALLGTTSGNLFFRDRNSGPCHSEGSAQTNLTTLPQTWSSGPTYTDCPISSYGKTSP